MDGVSNREGAARQPCASSSHKASPAFRRRRLRRHGHSALALERMFRYGVFDLVHEAALRRALQDGRLAGAALDVLEDEESKINPFSDLPQVVVTPHSAGITRTSMPRALRLAAANIDRFLCGEPVVNLVTS